MARNVCTVIDLHVAKFPPAQAAALLAVRDAAVRQLPGAEQVLAWGMPALRVDGDAVLGFEGFRKHNSLFPMSGAVVAQLAGDLGGYEVTKGAVHFDLDRPIPASIIRLVSRTRLAEINASYPKKSGETKAFFDNGFVKFQGRMKDGEMHGAWRWYRKDGTVMRTGSFSHGTKVGDWTTYDSTGAIVKVTSLS